jgi:hypothetical protein
MMARRTQFVGHPATPISPLRCCIRILISDCQATIRLRGVPNALSTSRTSPSHTSATSAMTKMGMLGFTRTPEYPSAEQRQPAQCMRPSRADRCTRATRVRCLRRFRIRVSPGVARRTGFDFDSRVLRLESRASIPQNGRADMSLAALSRRRRRSRTRPAFASACVHRLAGEKPTQEGAPFGFWSALGDGDDNLARIAGSQVQTARVLRAHRQQRIPTALDCRPAHVTCVAARTMRSWPPRLDGFSLKFDVVRQRSVRAPPRPHRSASVPVRSRTCHEIRSLAARTMTACKSLGSANPRASV